MFEIEQERNALLHMSQRMISCRSVERNFREVTLKEKMMIGAMPFSVGELTQAKQTHILVADFGDSIQEMMDRPNISGLFWRAPSKLEGVHMSLKEPPKWRLVPTIWMDEYDEKPISTNLHSARAIVYACVLWRMVRMTNLFKGLVIPSSDGMGVGFPAMEFMASQEGTGLVIMKRAYNYRRFVEVYMSRQEE